MKGYDKAPSGAADRARRLRRDATDAEKRLWYALREAFADAKFRRQVPVGPYIADFLSFRHKLIVELDGSQHTPDAGARRTAYLERQGLRVLRFWNTDALANTDGVLRRSLPPPAGEEISVSPPLPPRTAARWRRSR